MQRKVDEAPSAPVWDEPWPAAALEPVSACPLCGGPSRHLLHAALVDNTFRVAPGRWDLFRCDGCGSAYLDPRPTPASIGAAYGGYYTHAEPRPRDDSQRLHGLAWLKQALRNGYVNQRYGTARTPASRIGVWLTWAFPSQRQKRDAQFRYLPRPRPGQRLLDFGCGNGDFLCDARDAGWNVAGVDADPDAVAVARQRGLDVRVGGVEVFAAQTAGFDAITASHVLEHLHDPRHGLLALRALLKPGGVLYVDTPNIDARGAQWWGRDWRGLEAPRHLVLCSRQGLERVLADCGFGDVRAVHRSLVRTSMDGASWRIRSGRSPYAPGPRHVPWRVRLALACRNARQHDDEFLTVLAVATGPAPGVATAD